MIKLLYLISCPVAFKFNFGFGSNQKGIGFDISVGMLKGGGGSYRYHFGTSYYWNNYGNYAGKEVRQGHEFEVLPSLSYSTTHFKAGEFTQTTGMLTIGGHFSSISYENDWLFGIPGPDGGDRWRSAAVRMKLGGFSVYLNMFTGDPGLKKDFRISEPEIVYDKNGNPHLAYSQLDANNPNQRAGVLSFGFGPLRLGNNSERIRHVFQNRFAHDFLTGGKAYWFKVLDIPSSFYWYIGTGSGDTLW